MSQRGRAEGAPRWRHAGVHTDIAARLAQAASGAHASGAQLIRATCYALLLFCAKFQPPPPVTCPKSSSFNSVLSFLISLPFDSLLSSLSFTVRVLWLTCLPIIFSVLSFAPGGIAEDAAAVCAVSHTPAMSVNQLCVHRLPSHPDDGVTVLTMDASSAS